MEGTNTIDTMDAPGSKDVIYDEKVVVKVQAFVRGCLCRAKVSAMVQAMIDELLAKRGEPKAATTPAATASVAPKARPLPKREGSVANIMSTFEAKNKEVHSPSVSKKNLAPRRKLEIPKSFDPNSKLEEIEDGSSEGPKDPDGEVSESNEDTKEEVKPPSPMEKPLVSPVFKKRVWPPPKTDIEKKYDPVVIEATEEEKAPEVNEVEVKPKELGEAEPQPEPEPKPEKEPEPEPEPEKEAEAEETAVKEEKSNEKDEEEAKPVVPPPAKEKPLVSPVFRKRIWPPPKTEIEKKYDPVVIKRSEPKAPEPEEKGPKETPVEEENDDKKEEEPAEEEKQEETVEEEKEEEEPTSEDQGEEKEEESPQAAEEQKTNSHFGNIKLVSNATKKESAAKKDLEEQNVSVYCEKYQFETF